MGSNEANTAHLRGTKDLSRGAHGFMQEIEVLLSASEEVANRIAVQVLGQKRVKYEDLRN